MPSSRSRSRVPGYEHFLGELKQRTTEAQFRAALAVNRDLVLLYWSIGRDILDRQRREGWGARVIDTLAEDLTRAFPAMTGFSARNLKYMRAFAEAWPVEQIVQQAVAQLPWGHQIVLIEQVKSPEQRLWYVHQDIQNGWSRAVLVHQIESGLYKRQGRALSNFDRTLPAPQSELAQQILKDPYNFDFLSLGPEIVERDLELGLIEHLRDLILELGKGFSFVGSQYHLEVGGQDYYLDLLFYHLRLRCFVVIDLKIEDFKPEFSGKMNFYLSAVDDQLRYEHDNASIGIILCKGKNSVIVEYALRDTNKPMGVSEYRLTPALPQPLLAELPTAEDLEKEFPLLSLVQLRIAMEKALTRIVREKKPELVGEHPSRSIGQLVSILYDLKMVSNELLQKIRSASQVLSMAVHGKEVDSETAEAAVSTGKEILGELEAMVGRSRG